MKLNTHEVSAAQARVEDRLADDLAQAMQLLEWGKWSRSHGDHLGYPVCLLRFCANNPNNWERDLSTPIGSIDDDTALRIEAAITALDFTARKIVVTLYKERVPLQKAHMVTAYPVERIREIRNRALGQLWDTLGQDQRHAATC